MRVCRFIHFIPPITLAALVAVACGDDQTPPKLCDGVPAPCVSFKSGAAEQEVASAFAQAKPGTTFIFDSGTYAFTNTLNLAAVDGVTVRGQGIDKTILDFKGQAAGADGILAEKTNGVTFRDFWVRDPASAGVRVNKGDGVYLRHLKVSWTTPDISKHGAYGIYPVLSHNVVLEDSTVSGASDSGICASQLDHAIVRRNEMSGNVAGIIVRNGYVLDVLENTVHDNSVGIVVGTLSGDEQLNGHDIRIADNHITNNNVPGLNRPDATVDRIPSGAGLVVVGNHRAEVLRNTITDNGTNAIAVVSLFFAQIPLDPGIDPFPTNVYVHDNTLTGNGAAPDQTKPLGQLLASGAPAWEGCCGGRVPDILFDGVVNPALPAVSNPMAICVKPGAATFANLHADQLDDAQDNLALIVDVDAADFDCSAPVLEAVVVPGA
jgi:parallel beta-helix repeat protein